MRTVVRRVLWPLGLALLVGLSPLLPGRAAAQGSGTLVSRVTDSEAGPMAGVEVRSVGSALLAVTDRTGAYRMVNLPAGEHRVAVTALGYAAGEATIRVDAGGATVRSFALDPAPLAVEGIEVSGQRRGQALAMQQQRRADNIRTVVSSEYIGRFPDPNAAEAVQRLPGVSVCRDQGGGLSDYGAYEFDEYELNDNLTTDTDFTTSLNLTLPSAWAAFRHH